MNSIVSRLTRLCICEFDPPYLVRADTNQGDVYSSCDFENSSQPVHLRDYLKADYELYPTPSAFNYSQGTNETCQMLKNFEAPVGVGKLLKVMATDDLQVSVDYYIPTVANPTSANANGLQSLVQAIVSILNNTGYSGAMHGQGAAVGGSLQHSIPLQALMQQQSPANPTNLVKAYLNVLFFDEQFNFVCQQSQFYPLNTVGSAQHFYLLGGNSITVPANGYAYIYVSNESDEELFFDNFQITHTPGRIVEETSYYPFGLVMAGISSKAANITPNKEKTFQGQRFDDELGLNWIQFKWRNHDPQIGRFIEIDPLAEDYEYNSTYAFSENKVTNHVELEGLEAVSAGSVQSWLGAGFGQITEAIGRGIDNVTSFFTRSETEVSKPSSVTSASTVFTSTSTTEYGTNVFGWIQNSKKPDATVSNGPSLFKADTKTENKVELKQEVKTNQGTVSTKTALDGSSQEIKVEGKVTIRKVPVTVSVSNSQNFQTGENKTKVKAGTGSSTNQAFGQVEVSKQNGNTKTSVSVGVEEKTGNVKKTLSIGKSF